MVEDRARKEDKDQTETDLNITLRSLEFLIPKKKKKNLI